MTRTMKMNGKDVLIPDSNEQLEARIKVLEEAFLVLQQRVKDYESQ